mmetsp:Transcript_15054/g.44374  ORF Transcript_15054/g.44374 Transcript_15054/m.44374 type:complete len:202 (+) Transcript_15054:828-1433(+)
MALIRLHIGGHGREDVFVWGCGGGRVEIRGWGPLQPLHNATVIGFSSWSISNEAATSPMRTTSAATACGCWSACCADQQPQRRASSNASVAACRQCFKMARCFKGAAALIDLCLWLVFQSQLPAAHVSDTKRHACRLVRRLASRAALARQDGVAPCWPAHTAQPLPGAARTTVAGFPCLQHGPTAARATPTRNRAIAAWCM